MGFHHKCSQWEGSVMQNKGRYFKFFHLLNNSENHLIELKPLKYYFMAYAPPLRHFTGRCEPFTAANA